MTQRLIIDGSLRRSAFTLQVQLDLGLDQPVGLQGVTGAGKTTLLRIIAGLEPDFTGHLQWGARVWTDSAKGISVPTHQRQLGVVFQDARLLPEMTVSQNLRFAVARAPSELSQHQLATIAEDFHVGDLMARPVEALSGGERQRVSLVQALLRRPQLLLLDEPLSANDRYHRRQVASQLSDWIRREQVPLICVSHSTDELNLLTHTTLRMDSGRVVAQGATSDMLESATARAHMAAKILEVDKTRGEVKFQWDSLEDATGSAAWKPGDRIFVGYQPELSSEVGAPLKPESEEDQH